MKKNQRNLLIVIIIGIFCCALFMGLIMLAFFTTQAVTEEKILNGKSVADITYSNYVDYLKSPNGQILEEVSGNAGDSSLKVCGGIAPIGYNLKTDTGNLITDKQELIRFIGGIKTVHQAAAFLYATQVCDFQGNFGNYESSGRQVLGGFEISLVSRPTFGCGRHEHELLTYKVMRNGNVNLTNEKFIEQKPESAEVCVD